MALERVITAAKGLSADVKQGFNDQRAIVAGRVREAFERVEAEGFDPGAVRDEINNAAKYISDLAKVVLTPVSTLEDLKRVFVDALTGLLNQGWILDYLESEAFRRSLFEGDDRRESNYEKKKSCMVFFDLDRFGVVNEAIGPVGGDNVLKLFSERMKELFRDSDILTRFGGEEFMVILPGMTLKLGDSFSEAGACVVNRVLEDLGVYFGLVEGEMAVFTEEGLAGRNVVDMSDITELDKAIAGDQVIRLIEEGNVMRVTFSAGVSELSLKKILKDRSTGPTVEAVGDLAKFAKHNGRNGVAYECDGEAVVYEKSSSRTGKKALFLVE
ncbi:GGDEF domain-containing protein [Candidatus Gracilibacteria bacterium]|nr:GGDEF domain-containing protein [Candidatus Gracilibacteria bacterium]